MLLVQDYQINITESMSRKVGQDIQPPGAGRGVARYDGKIEVTFGVGYATSGRTKQVHSPHSGIFLEDSGQEFQVWKVPLGGLRVHALSFSTNSDVMRLSAAWIRAI